ncbi:unnamed protein product [Mycena citricolor]|uniref:Potassium channel domain-containing protein n=1 Tax=Mycena citricolor TaxID=2018698 RepID=A0AAD2GV70_9AGAR|nr:unnamed protein product [Mycena citricolor]
MRAVFPVERGVVEPWIVPDTDVVRPNPSVRERGRLTDGARFNAMTGLSLAFSLLANIILLANFLHILRYSISQWLTISFWYISALLLIIPLGLSRHVLDAPGTDYTQSFYYAIIASVLYVILPSLLALNALGAYKFKAYAPSFNPLTIPQRTLMAQTLAYVLYIAGGAAVFARVEGWDYLDGVYWAEYTLLTIGLGSDFPPKTHLGRALLIPYAVGGITVIGLIVGSIRGLIIERGGVKLVRRTVEEERQKWISRMGEPDERWKKDEWDAMRRIKRRAESMRRWSALASSALAFFFLWLLGALVFWFAESAQEWTYFQSLYFSYTSLLTIGYGDFYPQSNAGKPFFVVWSLMAVPTVTILISNVGEILIGLVRRALMMAVFSTAAAGADKNNKKSDDERKMGADLEHLGEAVEQSERQRGLGGGLAARLSREVARLAQDAMSGTEAEYSWEDWQGWLELLGERTDAEGRGENEEKQGEWTWLGEEGPLLSGMSETQWILQRLCERLQQVLEEEYGSKR